MNERLLSSMLLVCIEVWLSYHIWLGLRPGLDRNIPYALSTGIIAAGMVMMFIALLLNNNLSNALAVVGLFIVAAGGVTNSRLGNPGASDRDQQVIERRCQQSRPAKLECCDA